VSTSLICDCGHDNRQHGSALTSPFMHRPCSVADCDCTDFRAVGQGDAPEGGEAA
jgi:hypothetical protein